jgi:hypothetical protein
MTRSTVSIVGGCVGLLAAGLIWSAFLTGWPRAACFESDALTGDRICGTPREIEAVQFDRGRDSVRSIMAMTDDAVEMCVSRSIVQGQLNDWPERYRVAYEAGCREGGQW